MFKTVLVYLTLLFFLGCRNPKPIFLKSPTIDDRFDSGMVKVVKKYSDNYGKKLDPPDGSHSYSEIFTLKKRVLLPDLKNLTFDYKIYIPCGGCWTYKIVHVYNDSMSFILPFTDDEVYWKMSSKQLQPSSYKIESLNFNNELKDMIKYFKIRDNEMIKLLVDEIMRNYGFWKLDMLDIPKLALISNDVMKNDFYIDHCRDKLLDNLKKTESSVKHGKIVYSNGLNVAIFTISNEHEVSIEMTNTECNSMILY